jgi:copper chaperone
MITFQVPDMTCGRCAGTIARAIAAEDPSARVEFEMDGRLVRVTPSAATASELQSALLAAGYRAQEVQAHAAPRATGGGCGCGCASQRTRPLDVGQPSAVPAGGCCG